MKKFLACLIIFLTGFCLLIRGMIIIAEAMEKNEFEPLFSSIFLVSGVLVLVLGTCLILKWTAKWWPT